MKQAENESDLTSNTEKEEYLKKSRKHRAAKTIDTSMSSGDELSEVLLSEFSTIPNFPNTTNTYKNKSKNTRKKRKGKSIKKLL